MIIKETSGTTPRVSPSATRSLLRNPIVIPGSTLTWTFRKHRHHQINTFHTFVLPRLRAIVTISIRIHKKCCSHTSQFPFPHIPFPPPVCYGPPPECPEDHALGPQMHINFKNKIRPTYLSSHLYICSLQAMGKVPEMLNQLGRAVHLMMIEKIIKRY